MVVRLSDGACMSQNTSNLHAVMTVWFQFIGGVTIAAFYVKSFNTKAHLTICSYHSLVLFFSFPDTLQSMKITYNKTASPLYSLE